MARSFHIVLLACAVLACDSRSSSEFERNDSSGAVATARATGARTLQAGTIVHASIQDAVSSRTNAAGQRVTAIISQNVMDGSTVLIPGGAAMVLTIAQLAPARRPSDADGVIALHVVSLTVGKTSYEPNATVGIVPHTLLGRAPGGALTATQTDRDVIVTPGTPITITLTQPLTIAAS